MKKYIFFSMFFISMFFTSCTNKDNTSLSVEKSVETEVIALQNDLLALNNEMFGEQIITKSKWWKYMLTAIVDAGVGLITGNFGTAISASSLTWTIFKEVQAAEGNTNDTAFQSLNDETLSLTYLEISEEGCNAGVIHNQVIINLYERYGEELFNLPEGTLFQEVANETANLTECSPEDIFPDIEATKDEVKIYTDAYIASRSIDEYINYLKNAKPEKAAELDILKIALEGFQFIDIETDNGEYASAVIDIIDDSEIPTEMKDDLRSSIEIANASTRLWNTESIVEE